MRTKAAVDAQLHLAVHKARRMPRWHPDYADLHADMNRLLAERETAPVTVRPSQVRANASSVRP